MKKLCRKLYKEFFYVPKYGKVREKVMLTRVVTSVTIVMMCLAAMSYTAYAYFSYNISSCFSTIKAANFEAKVDVQIADKNGEPVAVTTGGDNTHTAELKANTEYFVTMQATERSTAKTGFVIITAENCDSKYHTEQLGKDSNGNAKTVTFWLKPTATTTVTFLSRWGTSSFYPNYIQTGENSELYVLTGEHVSLSVTPVKYNAPLSSNTEGTTSVGTTLPATEDATPPVQTTPSGTTGTSEPAPATKPSDTIESTVTPQVELPKPSATLDSAVTQPTDTTESSAITEPTVTQATASIETTEMEGTKETEQTEQTLLPTEATEVTDIPATEANHA